MRLLLVMVMLAASVALGAGKKKKKAPPAPPPIPTEPSPQLVEAMTERNVALLTSATKVVFYRVTFQPGVRPNPQLAVGVDYERTGKGRELTEGELKRFKGLLYDAKSFKWSRPPPCGNFSPDVAFVATSEEDTGTLEGLISFKCNGLMFFAARTAGRSLPGAQLDLRPSRKALLTMVKELMVQDPMVQAIR